MLCWSDFVAPMKEQKWEKSETNVAVTSSFQMFYN